MSEIDALKSSAASAPSGAIGNGAKLREALEFLIKHEEWLRGHNLTMTLEDLEIIDRILGKARAALAAPPRNCDVGTAVEQTQRFDDFCYSHSDESDHYLACSNCECKDAGVGCELAWAQLPYNESEVADETRR